MKIFFSKNIEFWSIDRLIPYARNARQHSDEQIAQARRMIENGDNERADYMTLRAYNDAEVALGLAREDAARKRADELQARLSRTPQTAQ